VINCNTHTPRCRKL